MLRGGFLDACSLLLLLVFHFLQEHNFPNIMKATVTFLNMFMAGYRLSPQGQDWGYSRKCLVVSLFYKP